MEALRHEIVQRYQGGASVRALAKDGVKEFLENE
jgi:hypothetical protein